MIRMLLPLTFVLLGTAGFGQEALQQELAPGPGMDAPRCGQFVALDSLEQVRMLGTIQPLGDEIDPNDAEAARKWAAEVTEACGGDGERPLAEAAREALGE
jgi:hypothetical protein